MTINMKLIRSFTSIINAIISVVLAFVVFACSLLYCFAGIMSDSLVKKVILSTFESNEFRLAVSNAVDITDYVYFIPETEASRLALLPSVQNAIAESLNDFFINSEKPEKISIANRLADAFVEDSDGLMTIYNDYMNDTGVTYDDIYFSMCNFATSNNAEKPTYGNSIPKMCYETITNTSEKIDTYVTAKLNEVFDRELEDDALPKNEVENNNLVERIITKIKKAVDDPLGISISASFLNTMGKELQKLSVFAILTVAFVAYIAVMLLSLSTRIPLIFEGVLSAFAGAVLAFFPMTISSVYFENMFVTVKNSKLVLPLIVTIGKYMSESSALFGYALIGAGAVMTALYLLLTKRYNKKRNKAKEKRAKRRGK